MEDIKNHNFYGIIKNNDHCVATKINDYNFKDFLIENNIDDTIININNEMNKLFEYYVYYKNQSFILSKNDEFNKF